MTDHSDGSKQKIFRICLTGGPCAGKTTALSMLQEKLQPSYKVFLVPELATLTSLGGYDIRPPKDIKMHVEFSKVYLQQQVLLENYFISLAKLNQDKDAVIIMDRGYLDNFAYLSKETKDLYLEETKDDLETIRDSRYDMVLHLVTAANGAADKYTTANNQARSEGIQQAIDIDNKIKAVWTGHPNHIIIGNDQGFNEKIAKVYNSIVALLGYPREITYVRKYLIKDTFHMADFPADQNKDTFKEILTYLDESETELSEVKPGLDHISYVKKRESPSGHCSFSYIVRILSEKFSERMELRRNITNDDYYYRRNALRNKERFDFIKLVTVFVYQNCIYNLETVRFGEKKIRILRCLSYSQGDQTLIPPFIPVEAEVTFDEKYYSQNMCMKQCEDFQLIA